MIAVPWADSDSGYIALIEALVIDWLQEATAKAVARMLKVSWGVVDWITQRAVTRGLAWREALYPVNISVDGTFFQKQHEYVTVVTDLDASRVLFVADNRSTESLGNFHATLDEAQLAGIRAVAMDMWPAYVGATQLALTDAGRRKNYQATLAGHPQCHRAEESQRSLGKHE